MRQESGFTLVELMVVIAILGILAVTAMPFYQTWQQRAHGTRATAVARQLVDGEIMHFLENDKFIPDEGETLSVFSDSDPSIADYQKVANGLHVNLPLDSYFDYHIYNDPMDPEGKCVKIVVSAPFVLFKDGRQDVIIRLFQDGRYQYF
jgi:prepilin-type N-terminal cleavage/methylation domain-containing protein